MKLPHITRKGGFSADFCGDRPTDGRTRKLQKISQPLGIITKSQVVPENKGLQRNDLEEAQKLVELFALQNLACNCLTETVERTSKDGKTYQTYVHRVNYCQKRRIDATKPVNVKYNPVRGKAHYDNVQRCGSVWTCIICGRKIIEGRRKEVRAGVANWQARGGYVYMMTLTNRHHQGDNLQQLLKGQAKAKQKLWEKTKVKKMMQTLGYVGRITATESPYSDVNGWHPHYHVLLFFDHEINAQGLQTFLGHEWIEACRKAGMKLPTIEHGIRIDKADLSSGDYIAKWGVESELTKGHVKKGCKDSLTPFDLLRQSEDNPRYRHLFRQFADAFKGKRQLHWTKGLKALLGVDEVSDEQLAEETEKQSVEIKEVATQIWRIILRYKIRGEYLNACRLDYLEGGANDNVVNLIMPYAEKEAERIRRR